MQLIFRALLFSLAFVLAAEPAQADNPDINLLVHNAGRLAADFSLEIKPAGASRGDKR